MLNEEICCYMYASILRLCIPSTEYYKQVLYLPPSGRAKEWTWQGHKLRSLKADRQRLKVNAVLLLYMSPEKILVHLAVGYGLNVFKVGAIRET